MTVKTRKRRSDRKHVIYLVVNVLTGERYVGLTVAQGGAYKRSVKVRWQKHVSRALIENRDWAICKAIRKWGAEVFDYCVLEVVRGKKAAHKRELEIIREFNPELNTI
jgi:hypothetical protein